MTTTDMSSPSAPPPSAPPVRRLRRSRNDRIGAGVAGGLGEYFGVDPVLFRVLFATAAFFGGAGVLAYLIAWAAIPEEGTERAAIDGWPAWLRAHRVPLWVAIATGGFLLWLIAFSWWAPGPFVPVIVVVIILVAIFGRRPQTEPDPEPPTVNLWKTPDAGPAPAPATSTVPGTPTATPPSVERTAPVWVGDTRTWMRDARAARRARLRRAAPVKITTLITFVVAMVVVGLIDAAKSIPLSVYFWVALAILGTGLIVGLATRRASWSVALLLVVAIIGTVSFAGTKASLSDGVGQKQWKPAGVPATSYKLAFGQGVLDLRSLPILSQPANVRIDQAAGQVVIIAPKTLNLTVHANVHIGVVTVNGREFDDDVIDSDGINVSRTLDPLPTATGPAVTVDVHLADGNIDLRRP